jgi:predicted ABC-type ATPase
MTPRLRGFVGPNGSGKSTIKDSLKSSWRGVYLNADDLEKALSDAEACARILLSACAPLAGARQILR